jgi:hypothetical protein
MNEGLTMLYARVSDKSQWPLKWEKCEAMFKHLNRMTYGFQLEIHGKMFATQDGPEHRAVLIKWVNNSVTRDMKRETLLDTCDPEQMEAALFMLINEAEQAAKAAKWVSAEL